MNITITTKKERFLKKRFNTEDIQPFIQQVVDNYIDNLVIKNYDSSKSVDDKIDELTK